MLADCPVSRQRWLRAGRRGVGGVRGDELRAFRGVLLGLALGAGLWLGLIYLAVRR